MLRTIGSIALYKLTRTAGTAHPEKCRVLRVIPGVATHIRKLFSKESDPSIVDLLA